MTTEFKIKSWNELSELEQLESTYCEMHKDVYGVKARWYKAESVEQARRDLEALGRSLEIELAREQDEHNKAILRFEATIKQLIMTGARDRETALRWLHQANGTEGDNEALEYRLGLPFDYIKKEQA